MPAPFPYDAVAGRISPEQLVGRLIADYKWLARWSNEIGQDADLDLKKLAQLAFIHCRDFKKALDPLVPLTVTTMFVDAIRGRMVLNDLVWASRLVMVADLNAIHTKCADIFTHVRDNEPAVREFAQRTYDAQGAEIEVPAIVSKANHPIAVQKVAELRALFE